MPPSRRDIRLESLGKYSTPGQNRISQYFWWLATDLIISPSSSSFWVIPSYHPLDIMRGENRGDEYYEERLKPLSQPLEIRACHMDSGRLSYSPFTACNGAIPPDRRPALIGRPRDSTAERFQGSLHLWTRLPFGRTNRKFRGRLYRNPYFVEMGFWRWIDQHPAKPIPSVFDVGIPNSQLGRQQWSGF